MGKNHPETPFQHQMTESFHHRAYIAVGSNMGDKAGNCRKGIAGLEQSGNSRIRAVSPLYQTAPVDYEDQDRFVNAVVCIATGLEPASLLAELNAIEQAAGRCRKGPRFGPRTLDMDIIFFDNVVMNTGDLILPHPRMHKRRFVLQPLCDMDADILHPLLGKTVGFLLEQLDADEQEIRLL